METRFSLVITFALDPDGKECHFMLNVGTVMVLENSLPACLATIEMCTTLCRKDCHASVICLEIRRDFIVVIISPLPPNPLQMIPFLSIHVVMF